jgi:uncharacterized protein (TIGR03066 family)
MRGILGLALVVGMGLAAGADDKDTKIDGKKLIGKWTPDSAPKEVKAVIEFTKDGKVNVTIEGEAVLSVTSCMSSGQVQ